MIKRSKAQKLIDKISARFGMVVIALTLSLHQFDAMNLDEYVGQNFGFIAVWLVMAVIHYNVFWHLFTATVKKSLDDIDKEQL